MVKSPNEWKIQECDKQPVQIAMKQYTILYYTVKIIDISSYGGILRMRCCFSEFIEGEAKPNSQWT